MNLTQSQKIKLVWGMLIGALLGAGASWLLMEMPADRADGDEPGAITAKELLGLTSAAALLIRKLDDFRHKM